MRGFIAPTDSDWFDLLLDRQTAAGLEEVNFWRPSARVFKALRPGEPVLFKLKAPRDAIGGFAIFERFSVLPVWLAWEAFRQDNGVPSLAVFEQRLRVIRARNHIADDGELRVGCLVLAQPVLFPPELWVRRPADWKARTVSGETYDLDVGEGARVWRDCLERSSITQAPIAVDVDAPRYGSPTLIAPRLGQAGFRIAVTEAYDHQCAVTREHSLPVLDAAHIHPYADGGPHRVDNGLLLRSDIHRLYDRGYVTITPELRFEVSTRLRRDYNNGRTYYALHGQPIVLPRAPAEQPNLDALRWHAEHRFLG